MSEYDLEAWIVWILLLMPRLVKEWTKMLVRFCEDFVWYCWTPIRKSA